MRMIIGKVVPVLSVFFIILMFHKKLCEWRTPANSCYVGHGGVTVRALDFQSREPRFKSSFCHFKALANLFIPHCLSSLSCINDECRKESNRLFGLLLLFYAL